MLKKSVKTLVFFVIYNLITAGFSWQIYASQTTTGASDFNNSVYVATVEVQTVNINREYNSTEVLKQAYQGEQYRIVEDMGDGWLKIDVNGINGYIPMDGNTTINKVEDSAAIGSDNNDLAANSGKRDQLVNYAMQFVGGRYSYGGNDPRTGVDCSGFTKFVLQNGAGVNLGRSSQSQAGQGTVVSADQIQPGDLVFYGNGKRINHVGMYIGQGQIVHASTNRTGIKVSQWTYRQPVKIVNVLGDI